MMQMSHAVQVTAPAYLHEMQRTLGVLQQLQVMLAHDGGEVTLEDVAQQIAALQAEFGSTVTLEDVIQTLVARQLTDQLAQRQAARQEMAA